MSRELSSAKREQIVALHQHTDFSYREIARRVGCSDYGVRKIMNHWLVTGSTDSERKGKCGRKPLLNPREKMSLVRESKKDNQLTLREIRQNAGEIGVKISRTTVHRILHSAGRKAYRPIKVPLISAANRKKRLVWARAHSGMTVDDWKKVRKMHSTIHKMFATLSPFVSQVIFSDETTLIVGPARRAYVRRGDGERISSRHLQPRCAYPIKLMVWACFSWFGTGVLEVVEGSINSQRYINIIDNALVPSADLWYQNNEWQFQQDNAPCHVSLITRQHMDSIGIRCLEWPPNSPDLNPIENFWSILKRRVYARATANKDDLMRRIRVIWDTDSEMQSICKTLVESMPKRVKQCIFNRGGPVHSY
jgi:transposase